MCCNETWKGATGEMPMHDMTDEHLLNAYNLAQSRARRYLYQVEAAEKKRAESERRINLCLHEMRRRQNALSGRRRAIEQAIQLLHDELDGLDDERFPGEEAFWRENWPFWGEEEVE